MKIDVELKNVTKKFGDFVAVDNVSFRIKKGEFFSLLGPSGCGKTTTLRMISGFEEPTEGEVYIAGELMNEVPPFKRPTNLVFQHLALFPHMNVYENIAFGLKMKKLPKKEIEERVSKILKVVDLPGFENRKIKELSGGQQQRVAIARALVNRPTVLLLDEPLGALDLKLRIQMQIELKNIQHRVGTTFVYVTHDQGEAITMSDRIAVMNMAKIEQIGSCEEIYERPKTKFVADFIGEANLIDGRYKNGVLEADGLKIRTETKNFKGSACISVRPEKIFIDRNLSNLENIFYAKVTDVIYQGSITTYKVELENGIKLRTLVQNVTRKNLLKPGERVMVGWNVENSVLILQ